MHVEKLRIYGAEEATCMWVRSYMTDRLQLVQVGNCKSEKKQVKYRIPQGSGLSPLLCVLLTSNMPDACSAFLIMYADDTNCFVAGDTADDAKKKLEIAALQIVAYMEENKICPNAAKTEYMLFGRRHGGEINVSGELVKESESLSLLGLTINKSISWEHHLRRVEKELSSRIWAFHRLRGYLPQQALLKIIPGFFNSKAIYMLDVISDPTGEETGSGTGGTVHRLQIKQNKGLRAIFGIRSEDQVGEQELLKRAKVLGIRELSNRLNYMLAWRIFSPFGDLQDLASDRLNNHEHEHRTRSAASGDKVQQTAFPSFIKKCATIFIEIRQITLSAKSKCAAKERIRLFCKSN
jgi:hypothetical protein